MNRVGVFAPNWLGDAVMSLPALADVMRASADGCVEIVAPASIAPLYTLVAGLGKVVELEPGADDVGRIRPREYEVAVIFRNSFRSAFTAWRAGIPERWGYRADLRLPLLTRSVAVPSRAHQVDYYRSLVRALGFPNGPGDPRLEASAGVRAAGAQLLERAGWDRRLPLVAFAPGAAYGGAKRWPATSFAAVADSLTDNGVRAVLVGSAADKAAGEDVVAHVSRAVPINLIGLTDLPLLAGTLAHCRALLTNDSGAMHIAAALGVPVTAIFGPTNERETSPRGPGRHVVLTSAVWCRPCMLRECPLMHGCMRRIRVADVVDALGRTA